MKIPLVRVAALILSVYSKPVFFFIYFFYFLQTACNQSDNTSAIIRVPENVTPPPLLKEFKIVKNEN